jgi:hypothetical protein
MILEDILSRFLLKGEISSEFKYVFSESNNIQTKIV